MSAPPDIAERLRTLAALAETGELPATTIRRLSRAASLAERDRCIYAACQLAGGTAALLEALERDGWRLPIWRQRGRVPAVAHPALAELYGAGPLPSGRHVRRILAGHEMSGDPG